MIPHPPLAPSGLNPLNLRRGRAGGSGPLVKCGSHTICVCVDTGGGGGGGGRLTVLSLTCHFPSDMVIS